MKHISGLAAAAVLLAASGSVASAPPAEMVIWGGPIHTADAERPETEAVAVAAGRIVWIGNRDEAKARVGPKTVVIDLKGAALYPGFTDAHAHLLEIGERELTLNLEGKPSLAAMLDAVAARAATLPPAEVLIGRGWIETHWPEGRFPTAADVDARVADRPVILGRSDGHALVANSAALRAAGVSKATPDPFGGKILRDASGNPTGMLVDAAMELVDKLRPGASPVFTRKAYRAAFDRYASRGWTGLHNMSVSFDDTLLLDQMAGEGIVPLRIYNAVIPEDAQRLISGGARATADGRITTRTLKYYMDGALGSRGAALFAPYDDEAESLGLIKMRRADTLPTWEAALRAGIQVTTHAIGDRANHEVLDWYEAAEKAVPPADRKVAEPRWRIEHAQNIIDADVPRFKALGVIPSMQPSHAIGDLYFAPKRLGEDRLKEAYRWRDLINAGVVIPGGSDAPVEVGDPRIEFYAAVARKGLDGFSALDWHPEQAVDREAALKMFTLWPAYASFREKDLGLIKPGYRADFTVFSRDLMVIPAADILKVEPLMTVLDGKVAWRAKTW